MHDYTPMAEAGQEGAGSTTPPSNTDTRTSILLAEDHASTRFMMRTLLERHGYRVHAVNDGFTAQGVLAMPDGPSIALLDWGLPQQTGLDVCRAVRRQADRRFIYTIVVTARDAMEDLAEAFAAGADDFIRKPCDPAEVLARIRSGERIVDLEHRLSTRIAGYEEALENVRRLKHLLPICMYCKKVRDDSQYWQEIDLYIHQQTGTDFSHGICPGCLEEVRAGQEPGEARRVRFCL